ncbi:MAG: transcriptional regulator [Actinobacteria bacterium HGW-Actinobacteria-5]|nr:MAG: transcriptional regulator [Actinobacteria bacterium HGW-Actinobacteria-5]
MPEASINSALGQRVRELRLSRGFSLSGLAAAARVGKGSLSELEAGARNPTLATLYALAGSLEVPISALVGEQVGTSITAGGLTHHLVDLQRGEHAIRETFGIVGEAGASRHSPAHGPGVSEHIVVTRGRMLAGPVGAEREAGAGEVLSWVSDSEHSYRVVEAPFEAILVILTPITP